MFKQGLVPSSHRTSKIRSTFGNLNFMQFNAICGFILCDVFSTFAAPLGFTLYQHLFDELINLRNFRSISLILQKK